MSIEEDRAPDGPQCAFVHRNWVFAEGAVEGVIKQDAIVPEAGLIVQLGHADRALDEGTVPEQVLVPGVAIER